MLPVIWDRRTRLVLVASQWVALALGIFTSIAISGPDPEVLGAAGLAGIFVLVTTSAPLDWLRRVIVLDVWVLAGVILTMTAVTLTGSSESPFLLLAITPTLWAGIFGGQRHALAAALLASALLLLVELGRESPNGAGVLLVSGIQLLLAFTISQVRRLLVDFERRQEQMVLSQQASNRRLEQLEDAHDLLTRLSELTAAHETNPIKLGNAALENLVARMPNTAAAAAIASDRGPVLVARVGIEPPQSHRITIPLRVAGRETGWIMLAAPRIISQTEIDGIEQSLRPLALAFSNVQLLQGIARKAISEERVRIARELHDDLGPSLASLGLGLDLAMVQHTPDQPLSEQLTHLRRSVSFLVDDIRKTVADLRSEPEPSISAAVNEQVTRIAPQPEVVVEVDERRPPRPAVAQELTAIVTEAIRNASRHAQADLIRVRGVVDFDRGWITVADDGRGFEASKLSDGHYGVVGMKERAEKIGGKLTIDSGAEGTTVSIEWASR